MKKINLVTFLICLYTSILAQTKDINNDNIVYSFYFNNGKVVRGKLIEFKAKEYAKVETNNHKIIEVKLAEVSKITKQDYDLNDTTKLRISYVGYFDAGIGLGKNLVANNRFRVNIINAVATNKFVSAGVGLGLRYYAINRQVTYPVYFNLRFNSGPSTLGQDNIFFLECGIGSAVNSNSGLYFNPSVGINLGDSKRLSTKIFLGFELQKFTSYGEKISDKSFILGIGTSFK